MWVPPLQMRARFQKARKQQSTSGRVVTSELLCSFQASARSGVRECAPHSFRMQSSWSKQNCAETRSGGWCLIRLRESFLRSGAFVTLESSTSQVSSTSGQQGSEESFERICHGLGWVWAALYVLLLHRESREAASIGVCVGHITTRGAGLRGGGAVSTPLVVVAVGGAIISRDDGADWRRWDARDFVMRCGSGV